MALRLEWVPILLACVLIALPAWAQDASLEVRYQTDRRPIVVVADFGGAVGQDVSSIIRRDLGYSGSLDLSSAATDPDWIVEGFVRPSGVDWEVEIRLGDQILDEAERIRATIPDPFDPGFRLAVHAMSDLLHEIMTGVPGIAASRIAFVGRSSLGMGLHLVNWDGEGLRLVFSHEDLLLTPSWAADGRRLHLGIYHEGRSSIREIDLQTGDIRNILERDGTNSGPQERVDGSILFSGFDGTDTAIFSLLPGGAIERLAGARGTDAVSPAPSPDGGSFLFVSDRSGIPELYRSDPNTRSGRRLAPFGPGIQVFAPTWSRASGRVAVHLRTPQGYQIGVFVPEGPRGRILTDRGRNEDPSWAPDGRHIVYRSTLGIAGLYVMDTETGVRRLIFSGDARYPAWSPRLD